MGYTDVEYKFKNRKNVEIGKMYFRYPEEIEIECNN